jgi:hypothetical protein
MRTLSQSEKPMNLVINWRRVVAISLSFWTQIALVVLLYPELKYAWTGEDSDPALFWWLGILDAEDLARDCRQSALTRRPDIKCFRSKRPAAIYGGRFCMTTPCGA